MDSLKQLVTQAQNGNDDAFGMLIGRFQDFAYATAYGYLGERMAAQDAAQEAFLEAYRTLEKLREPHAFPAWLRRIVYKRCDRQTRGMQPDLQPLSDWLPSHSEHPDYMLEQMQLRAAIRAAIHDLPLNYRAVAIPFYLHDQSLREVSDALDLSIGTIKKRLFTARQELRKKLMTGYTPSQDRQFSDKVRFAIALKKGDLTTIRQLLNQTTDHLTTYSEWGAGAYAWYYPLGQLPIHWAAETGHVALAKLLVEFGADVNSADKLNRTPLLLAAHMGQSDMLDWLLEQDVNLNTPMKTGQTALHIAAVDGRSAIVAKLLAAGTDANARDQNNYTPLDWAVFSGNQAIIDQFSEQTAKTTVGETKAHPTPTATTILETGIKIIDFMSPLKKGGINGEFGLTGGIGYDVMLGELMRRFAQFHGGRTVQIGLAHGEYSAENRLLQWRNLGVEENVELFYGNDDDSPARRQHLLDRALERVNELAEVQPVLLTAYSNFALADGVLDKLKAAAGGHVTVLITASEVLGAEPEALTNLDSAFTFSRARAQQSLWPAVDLLRSYGTVWESAEHAKLAQAVRRAYALYAELKPAYDRAGIDMFDNPIYTEQHRATFTRVQRLDQFLSQPLFVAQAFAGVSAEFVPYSHTLDMTHAILSGSMDDRPIEDFAFIGKWSPAWF